MDIEGVLAITFIFGGGTLFLLAMSPIGRAIADRIRGRGGSTDERVQKMQDLESALVHEIDVLRQELTEVQERLDFTERMLTRYAHTDKLSAGPDVRE